MTFFGKKFITVTLFIAGFVLVFMLIMGVSFGYFIKTDTSNTIKWVLVGLSAVLGILMGVAISR